MSNIDELLGEIEPPKLSNYAVLVLGDPKTGKSTFAASSATPEEKTIMLNLEKGLAFIQETENLRIYPGKEKACKMSDLRKLYISLKAGGHNYKNIVFDTADALWDIIWDDYLPQIQAGLPGQKPRPTQTSIELQDYVPMYEKYQKTYNMFRDLGLNVFFTAHTKRTEDDPKKVIALPGKLGGLIGGSVDMILHLTAKTTNGKMETTLYTQPNVLLDAGHRHFGVALPEKMINPVWADIPKILEKGIKKIEKAPKKEIKKELSQEKINKTANDLPDEDPNKDFAENETGVNGEIETTPSKNSTEEIFESLEPATTETKIPTDPAEIRKAFLDFGKKIGLKTFDDFAAFGKEYGFKSEEPEYMAQWLYETPDKLEIAIREFITEKQAKVA